METGVREGFLEEGDPGSFVVKRWIDKMWHVTGKGEGGVAGGGKALGATFLSPFCPGSGDQARYLV